MIDYIYFLCLQRGQWVVSMFDVRACWWTSGGSRTAWPLFLVLSLLLSIVSAHYTPQWAVHIPGGTDVADRIAAKHGFVNRGKVRCPGID